MNLLQIPILDDYWVPPQDPAAHNRSRDFAIEMGFGVFHSTHSKTLAADDQDMVSRLLPLRSSLLESSANTCPFQADHRLGFSLCHYLPCIYPIFMFTSMHLHQSQRHSTAGQAKVFEVAAGRLIGIMHCDN